MYRDVCTDLPILVQVVRIPDEVGRESSDLLLARDSDTVSLYPTSRVSGQGRGPAAGLGNPKLLLMEIQACLSLGLTVTVPVTWSFTGPSAAAVSQLPTGKPDHLCWLYL
jgi:hypothetical protein